jgi:hypothetical protein
MHRGPRAPQRKEVTRVSKRENIILEKSPSDIALHTHNRNNLVRVRELFPSPPVANALRSMFKFNYYPVRCQIPLLISKTALHTRRYHPADARRQFLVPPRRHENILASHSYPIRYASRCIVSCNGCRHGHKHRKKHAVTKISIINGRRCCRPCLAAPLIPALLLPIRSEAPIPDPV